MCDKTQCSHIITRHSGFTGIDSKSTIFDNPLPHYNFAFRVDIVDCLCINVVLGREGGGGVGKTRRGSTTFYLLIRIDFEIASFMQVKSSVPMSFVKDCSYSSSKVAHVKLWKPSWEQKKNVSNAQKPSTKCEIHGIWECTTNNVQFRKSTPQETLFKDATGALKKSSLSVFFFSLPCIT